MSARDVQEKVHLIDQIDGRCGFLSVGSFVHGDSQQMGP